jgi:hypothetical protein
VLPSANGSQSFRFNFRTSTDCAFTPRLHECASSLLHPGGPDMRAHLATPLLLAACCMLQGCATTPQASESLRVMTFNVQFLPPGLTGSGGDDVARPPRIVSRIVAGGYDFFVLNEVFDEDSRDLFVLLLASRYPHYVAYIGDDAVGSEDSGLMLFSRFPFEPLPVKTHRADPGNLVAHNGSVAPWKEVAFIEYEAHSFPDNWAAKGVAFVRIRNPGTGRIYNVAFTHMQASYPENEQALLNGGPPVVPIGFGPQMAHAEWVGPIEVRRSQMDDVRRIIVETLTPQQLENEDIFVLGDLNIDGDLRDPNLGAANCCKQSLFEYDWHFGTPGRFFTDRVKDTWATEQVPADPGLTNMYHWGPPFSPDMGARLDFFLRNQPSTPEARRRRLTVQHLTLSHNMRGDGPFMESGLGRNGIGLAGVNELSDHIGINADINLWSEYSSPLEARSNPPLNTPLPLTIQHPGSIQWLRFDQPGTYSFGLLPNAGASATFRVYAPYDMSTPAPNYFEEKTEISVGRGRTIEAAKYHVPDPPFYVRAHYTNRSLTGTFGIAAHLHAGASREDAIVLRANDPIKHVLPATPLNDSDRTWFELFLDEAASGKPQDLRFFVDQFGADNFSFELLHGDGTTALHTTVASEPDPAAPGARRLLLQRDDITTSGKLYLVVRRHAPGPADSYRIGWMTNLTVLHGAAAGMPGAATLNLYCVEETDTFGQDDIYLTVIADPDVWGGGIVAGGTVIVDDVYLGEFKSGKYRTLEDVLPAIRYLDRVVIRLRDSDGGLNFDDDIMLATIGALPADITADPNRQVTLACCGGEYVFRYNRSRSMQKNP